jgi:hypothetical protein
VSLLRSHRTDRRKLRALVAGDTCMTCEYVSAAKAGSPLFSTYRDTVARGERTTQWLAGSREVWRRHLCPGCMPERASARGVLCWLHLLADDRETTRIVDAADYLASLHPRLHVCVKSMTADGPHRSPDGDAALVEALGWFAGWEGCSGQ